MNQKMLGARLRELREEYEYDIEEVAEGTGMSEADLRDAENGRIDLDSDERLQLANFYCVPVEYFVQEEYDFYDYDEEFIFDKFSDFAKRLPFDEQQRLDAILKTYINYRNDLAVKRYANF